VCVGGVGTREEGEGEGVHGEGHEGGRWRGGRGGMLVSRASVA
jgi:hypothetical protein